MGNFTLIQYLQTLKQRKLPIFAMWVVAIWLQHNFKTSHVYCTFAVHLYYIFNSLMPPVSNMTQWITTSKQIFCFTIFSCVPEKAIITDLNKNLTLFWQDKVNILTLVGISILSCHKTLSQYKHNYHLVWALEG